MLRRLRAELAGALLLLGALLGCAVGQTVVTADRCEVTCVAVGSAHCVAAHDASGETTSSQDKTSASDATKGVCGEVQGGRMSEVVGAAIDAVVGYISGGASAIYQMIKGVIP